MVQPIPFNVHELDNPADDPSLFIKRIVIGLLKSFFANDREFTFSPNDESSRIRISDKNTFNLKEVEDRPAIVLDRGPITPSAFSIDQFQSMGGPASAKTFADIMNTSLTCMCHSKVGIEAESIAGRVFGFFTYFRDALRTVQFVHDFTPPTMGKEFLTKTDSRVDISMVPVMVGLKIDWRWKLAEQGPILRALEVFVETLNKELQYEEENPTNCE
jgi:hypothetical protein